MDGLALIVGYATIAIAGLIALRVLWSIGVSFAVASSILRWQFSCARQGRSRIIWRRVPGAFFRHVYDMIGHRKGSISLSTTNGEWQWIGDWRVFDASARTGDP